MSKKVTFTALVEMHEGNVWNGYVEIPTKALEQTQEWPSNRVQVTINGRVKKSSAILSSSKGFKYLLVAKKDRAALKAALNEPLLIEMEHDNSPYGMPVPQEWDLVIADNPEVSPYFEILSPGKKRSLLHLIGKYKSSEARMKKALAVAHHLIEDEGKLDFKRLNAIIKQYNNQEL